MIVDSSALVAILREEPDAAALVAKVASAPTASMSAASYFEAATVLDSDRNPILSRRLDDFVKEVPILVVPFTAAHAAIARAAYRDFGIGSGHRAKLNFGDCFAYALAKEMDQPLLFKGDDFVHTDVEIA